YRSEFLLALRQSGGHNTHTVRPTESDSEPVFGIVHAARGLSDERSDAHPVLSRAGGPTRRPADAAGPRGAVPTSGPEARQGAARPNAPSDGTRRASGPAAHPVSVPNGSIPKESGAGLDAANLVFALREGGIVVTRPPPPKRPRSSSPSMRPSDGSPPRTPS